MIELARPLFLLLLPVLLGLLYVAWRANAVPTLRSWLTLACRATICACLVLALAGLTLERPVDRQAVVFVGDLSASTADTRGAQERFISSALAERHPDDVAAIVATGGTPLVERVLSSSDAFDGFRAQVGPEGSDLAGGLRVAGGLLPAAYRTRVVLLSDGQQTTGDAAGQARLLRARGVQVDVVPLAVRGGPEVLVDQLAAPRVAHEGERYSVRATVVSNVATRATVQVFAGDALLGEQTLDLLPGPTDLSFGGEAGQSGWTPLRATVTAQADTLAQNNAAAAVVEVQGPPRVLVIEQRPAEAATVSGALQSSGMRVDVRPVGELPDQLDVLGGYAAVVLSDVAADSLTDAQHNALRAYVRDLGRGLVAIGGDTSFGQGDYVGTPLDELLPVRSSVRSHRDQGRVALVLVIDRSGSMADDPLMEGTTKLAMARQAALLSVQELSARDLIGVLAFDSFQQWLVPMTSVLSVGLPAIQDRIASLTAEGGTDVFKALTAGFEGIRKTDAQYRHVILLSDGMSCCAGDYPTLLDAMHGANVTLSTIAVGGDADQQLLQQLARQGDGRYYFAEHARDIPRLMTRETNLATRGPLVEGTISPRQVAPEATLSELAASGGLPTLGGYLVTSPKDLADVLLVSDAADPILARWPYGLGRTVAWTSDLRGRWSADWLQWSGLPRMLASQVNWTIAPARGPLEVEVRGVGAQGQIMVDAPRPPGEGTVVRARVVAPDGSPLDVVLPGSAPGRYQGSFPLAGSGTYLVRVEAQREGQVVAAADAALPVSYAAEFRRVTPDPTRLEQIARAGGGQVLSLETPGAAFADNLAPVTSPLPLQQALLLLAAVLLPLDVALRRLRVAPAELLSWLRHPLQLLQMLTLAPATLKMPTPSWLPGNRRTPVAPPAGRPASEPSSLSGPISPALAREKREPSDEEDDALAETLRWLAERRARR